MTALDLPTLAELYELHFDFVYRSLRRLGVRSATLEDATQDVFVVAQRRLSTFEQRSAIKTWLFGIAFRVARDHRRHASKYASSPLVEEALVGKDPDPQEAALITEATGLMQTLLDQLDEHRRAVFVLAEFEEFTAQEIAESLGIGANTVYSRLRLARRDLDQALRRLRARADWIGP